MNQSDMPLTEISMNGSRPDRDEHGEKLIYCDNVTVKSKYTQYDTDCDTDADGGANTPEPEHSYHPSAQTINGMSRP